jgi:hypothetical protein
MLEKNKIQNSRTEYNKHEQIRTTACGGTGKNYKTENYKL